MHFGVSFPSCIVDDGDGVSSQCFWCNDGGGKNDAIDLPMHCGWQRRQWPLTLLCSAVCLLLGIVCSCKTKIMFEVTLIMDPLALTVGLLVNVSEDCYRALTSSKSLPRM
eukprot:2757125-Amphidinium_carterae.1